MMCLYARGLLITASLAAGLLVASQAHAARLRYHYVPAGAADASAMAQSGAGERATLRGWEPVDCPAPRPTQVVTFRHPCTGRCVTLPLRLPEGTPQLEYRTGRVIYDYSGYTVEVHFLSDGSADVIYHSGLWGRPP